MAKKSNKTEQVLKLITKENEESDNSDEPVAVGVELPAGSEDLAEPEASVESVESVEPVEAGISAEPVELSKPEEPATPADPPAAPVNAVNHPAGDGLRDTPQPEFTAKAPAPSSAPVSKTLRVDQVHLINLTERLVREKAGEVMDRLNVCNCPICTQDILALTLNSLPNKFITTDAGRQHLQLEIYKKQYETDIIAALTRASVRVKASPRHGE